MKNALYFCFLRWSVTCFPGNDGQLTHERDSSRSVQQRGGAAAGSLVKLHEKKLPQLGRNGSHFSGVLVDSGAGTDVTIPPMTP